MDNLRTPAYNTRSKSIGSNLLEKEDVPPSEAETIPGPMGHSTHIHDESFTESEDSENMSPSTHLTSVVQGIADKIENGDQEVLSGGMVGRGGARVGFKVEGLNLGEGPLPGPCLQPAPDYPPLEHHPTPLTVGSITMAQLTSKLFFLSHLTREAKVLNYPWDYFPNELRPGTRKRKPGEKASKPPAKVQPVTSIDQLLADLEKSETAKVKVEVEEGEEKADGGVEEEEFEESDEEMDDGTDYNQNYFDNGEGYLDEDDDMDDGPTY